MALVVLPSSLPGNQAHISNKLLVCLLVSKTATPSFQLDLACTSGPDGAARLQEAERIVEDHAMEVSAIRLESRVLTYLQQRLPVFREPQVVVTPRTQRC